MGTETSAIARSDHIPDRVFSRSVSFGSRRNRVGRGRQLRRPLIIGDEFFRSVLIKERKRADRSNQTSVLLLVVASDHVRADSPSMWAPAIEALTAVTRETDVLGWFEWPTSVGVILPEIPAIDAAKAGELEARICRELTKRSDAQTAGRFSVRLHLHPEPGRVGLEARWPVAPLNVPELHSQQEPGAIDLALKRALDVIGSATLLVLLSPLFLLIAALVKLKPPGMVLFREGRIGYRMTPFTLLKFRTLADDPWGTLVARILRRTLLDALPQLWNVLRGEMSLVGPRPPLAHELEQYKPWHYRRVLEAKPGITGLWQVTGRKGTTFDEMVRLDLRYARTCSLWSDIKILCATPMALISRKTAC
jgi:lipopolysaccharide/colanic/teichoic acid biosynthesis glycosyltransferase